jgi:hypothetical protein
MNPTDLHMETVEETPDDKVSQRLADTRTLTSTVAEKILALCEARGLDPEDVRNALGLWCGGPDWPFRVDFRLSTLSRIARILGVKTTDLLG